MSESTGNSTQSTESAPSHAPATDVAAYTESAEELAYANRPFRGWRLLGIIGTVVLVLAIVSAVIDWMVIGPLEGRMF